MFLIGLLNGSVNTGSRKSRDSFRGLSSRFKPPLLAKKFVDPVELPNPVALRNPGRGVLVLGSHVTSPARFGNFNAALWWPAIDVLKLVNSGVDDARVPPVEGLKKICRCSWTMQSQCVWRGALASSNNGRLRRFFFLIPKPSDKLDKLTRGPASDGAEDARLLTLDRELSKTIEPCEPGLNLRLPPAGLKLWKDKDSDSESVQT
mmetsp:Transcript_140770/g.255928  ORF Transcript_140770/g.255928 Transcript_140770/m.255928 type:complete len:205 (+) Transcript_140770:321-935(+)